MAESSDLFAFYIVTQNDDFGESAHGPYTMTEAESLLREDETIITREHLTTLRQQSSPILATPKPDEPLQDTKMLREIRSWGITLLILGAIQILAAGFLSNTWGILLVIVGLASFYFRSAAMFVIYGTILSWAAVSNAFSSGGWAAFSLIQAFFAFQTFRQFFRFRPGAQNVQFSDYEAPLAKQFDMDKAARPFPWVGFILGLVSLGGLVMIFLGIFLFIGLTGNNEIPGIVNFAEGIIVDFAVLGLAAGLASLLLNYQHKLLSTIGAVSGGLVLLIEIGLNLLV